MRIRSRPTDDEAHQAGAVGMEFLHHRVPQHLVSWVIPLLALAACHEARPAIGLDRFEQVVRHRVHDVAQRIHRGIRIPPHLLGPQIGIAHGETETLPQVLHAGEMQASLAVEVVLERRRIDPGILGDLSGRGAFVTVLAEAS